LPIIDGPGTRIDREGIIAELCLAAPSGRRDQRAGEKFSVDVSR